jgi:integrase
VKSAALVKKQPLSALYIKTNHEDVRRHMVPFPGFAKLTVKDLTPGHVSDWQTWAAERGMSGRRINAITQTMRVAVRWAVTRGDLKTDVFAKINKAPDRPKEKGILTQAEMSALIHPKIGEPRDRAAALLGALCGLRRGEIRGLLWGDIDTENGMLKIEHNWQDLEGMKGPKAGSKGIVPMIDTVTNALQSVRLSHRNPASDAFVFESLDCPGKPLSVKWVEGAVGRCLDAIGIDRDERKKRNITTHSLRHCFVTNGRLLGFSDFEIATLARHNGHGNAMTERYSHGGQAMNMESARQRIEAIAV